MFSFSNISGMEWALIICCALVSIFCLGYALYINYSDIRIDEQKRLNRTKVLGFIWVCTSTATAMLICNALCNARQTVDVAACAECGAEVFSKYCGACGAVLK